MVARAPAGRPHRWGRDTHSRSERAAPCIDLSEAGFSARSGGPTTNAPSRSHPDTAGSGTGPAPSAPAAYAGEPARTATPPCQPNPPPPRPHRTAPRGTPPPSPTPRLAALAGSPPPKPGAPTAANGDPSRRPTTPATTPTLDLPHLRRTLALRHRPTHPVPRVRQGPRRAPDLPLQPTPRRGSRPAQTPPTEGPRSKDPLRPLPCLDTPKQPDSESRSG